MIFCSVCLTLSSCECCISLSLYGSSSTLDIDWRHKLTMKSRTTVKNTFPFVHIHILSFFMVCGRQVAARTVPSLLLSQLSRCCRVPAPGRRREAGKPWVNLHALGHLAGEGVLPAAHTKHEHCTSL